MRHGVAKIFPARRPLRVLSIWAAAYAAVGLASGLFYREFTQLHAFTGHTLLSLAHTHFLALGTLGMLLVLLLEKSFSLSDRPSLFGWFLATYNVGLVVTGSMFIIKGSLQVIGSRAADSAALAGIAGLGHVSFAVGFVLLFVMLFSSVSRLEHFSVKE